MPFANDDWYVMQFPCVAQKITSQATRAQRNQEA
jgi:hypothetical protein